MTFFNTQHKGFTLIELLVVIALIGVIATIALTNLLESREQSENAMVISQVYEYEKALQLYRAEQGGYPGSPYGRTGILCLGDEPAVVLDCLDSSAGTPIVAITNAVAAENLRAAIRPYMPTQPHITQPKGSRTFSSPAYSGCADFANPGEPNNNVTRQCAGSNFSLWFVLKGINEDCGRATVARPNFDGVYTLCRLQE